MKAFVVLAFACFALSVYGKIPVCSLEKQHPVVFFPGLFGTRLEEKLDIPSSVPMPHLTCERTSKDWETAWVEWKKVIIPTSFECLCRRLQMSADKDGRNWKNTEGVEIRVPDFGYVKSVDPISAELGKVIRLYGPSMDTLKKMGYIDGKTLIVASYDWRKMPSDEWKNQVREMIEKAVTLTGKKAVIFSHSMGGPMSYMFLMSQTAEWREKYIHHYIPVSPVWKGTCIIPYGMVTDKFFNFTGPLSYIGSLFRYLEGLYVLAPSIMFDSDDLVAYTDKYRYTAKNVSMLLERVKVSNADAVTRNVQEQLYKYDYEHPGIPLTSIWSTGDLCLGPFHWNKDSEVGVEEPIPSFVEGDGLVPLDSLKYATMRWLSGPHADITRGIPLPHSDHATTINHNVTMSTIFEVACDQ